MNTLAVFTWIYVGAIFKLMSTAVAEWVMAPTDIKSTPHSAMPRTV